MSDKVEIVGRTAKLDGRSSADPDGSALDYRWRLTSAPDTSSSVLSFDDASTSTTSRLNHADITTALVTVGDYVLFESTLYEVLTVAAGYVIIDGTPFTVGATDVIARIFRSNYIDHNDESIATLDIDVVGQYIVQLEVSDGLAWSDPVDILVDGREWESVLGEVIEGDYMWNYLSDFYSVASETEYLTNFFAGITQVAGNVMSKALQVETGVSLANIQPYFHYRWLHLNNIVEETDASTQSYTPAYGEVSSDATTLPADGNTLELRIYTGSELYTDITHTFSLGVAPTLTDVVTDLNEYFAQQGYAIQSSYFSRGGTDYITLSGTVAFEVLGGTAPIFDVGQTNWLYGLTGEKLDKRLYKIGGLSGHTLRNFTLNGHFLVIRGEAYKILSVRDDASDSTPSTRLVLDRDLPTLPTLADTATWAIPGYFTSSGVDWENELVFNADMAYLTLFSGDDLVEEEEAASRVVGVLGKKLGVFISSPDNDYYTAVQLTKVKRFSYAPLDSSVERIPKLQEIINEPTEWLTENNEYLVDYYRSRRCIVYDYFNAKDWTGAGDPIVPITIEDDIADVMWAELVIVTNSQTVSDNFGVRIFFDRQTYVDLTETEYLSSVRGLWFIFSRGKTIENLRKGMYIFFALPFAEKAGTITQIAMGGTSPYGRIYITDDEEPQTLRTYLFKKTLSVATNPTTGVPFAVGDHVDQFTPLTEGVEIEDWVTDPHWFGGKLGGHFMDADFYEVQKYHKWAVNIDAEAYTYAYLSAAQDFVENWRPRYLLPIFVVYHKYIDEFTLEDDFYWLLTLEFVDVFCHETPYLLDMGFTLDSGTSWALDVEQYCPKDLIDIQMIWSGSGASGGAAILDTIFFLDPDPVTGATGDEKGPLWILDDAAWSGATFPYTTDWISIYPW